MPEHSLAAPGRPDVERPTAPVVVRINRREYAAVHAEEEVADADLTAVLPPAFEGKQVPRYFSVEEN